MGPLTLPPKLRTEYGGLLEAKGFRESQMESVSLKNAVPRNLSVPGLVRISIRPKPSRSNSAENGF
jgi:hypothetical protein